MVKPTKTIWIAIIVITLFLALLTISIAIKDSSPDKNKIGKNESNKIIITPPTTNPENITPPTRPSSIKTPKPTNQESTPAIPDDLMDILNEIEDEFKDLENFFSDID